MASPSILRDGLILAVLSLILIFPGLFALEFFRHTEADRTLIAWQMLESGNFALPELLHTPILTKPPLFYWLAAFCMWMFSSTAEWAARLPSAFAGSLLVQLHYIFLRKTTEDRSLSFLASLTLVTSPLFLQLASAAEIDSLFAMLTASALFALFIGHETKRSYWFGIAYLVISLAALAKGPVALAILFGIDVLWTLSKRTLSFQKTSSDIFRICLGAVAALFVNSIWYQKAASFIGWDKLLSLVSFEVTRRFNGVIAREHSIFFYPWSLFLGLLPWSALTIGACILRRPKFNEIPKIWLPVLRFSLMVTGVVIVVLTCAAGKSSRYSLVVYPFASIIVAMLLFQAKDIALTASVVKILSKLFLIASLLIAVTGFACSYIYNIPLLTAGATGIASSLLLLLGYRSLVAGRLENLLPAILIIAIIPRIIELGLYSPYRNSSRSVKTLAEDISKRIPQNESLYSLEIAERWISYYLKQRGIETVRLTPVSASFLESSSSPINLILSTEDESWRVPLLQRVDPSTEIVQLYNVSRSSVVLVRTSGKALASLEIQEDFPTVLTPPPASIAVQEPKEVD